MTKKWKMLTKEDEKWANMQTCGKKMLSMNGECFGL
jgi:hypothetical protein